MKRIFVLALVAFLVSGFRPWQQEFGNLTPKQHFLAAAQISNKRDGEDLDLALRHLWAIPEDSEVYDRAYRLRRLVEVQSTRSEEFESVKQAAFDQCAAEFEARTVAEHGPGDYCGVPMDTACDVYSPLYVVDSPSLWAKTQP